MGRWQGFLPVIGAVTLLTFSLSVFAVDDDPERGWGKTTTDFSLVMHFAERVFPCNANAKNYLSCVHLVNAMGANAEPQQALIPPGMDSVLPGMKYTVVEDYGAMVLAKIDSWGEKAASVKDASERIANKEKALRQAAAAQLALNNPALDLEKLSYRLLQMKKASVSSQFVIASAVNDMITVHDGHGHIDAAEYMEAMQSNGDKNFDGIGAGLEQTPSDKRIHIVNVFKSSPAEAGGLKPNDVVLKVDNKDVTGQTVAQVATAIRGPKGTKVTVSVERNGNQMDVVLTRAPIVQPNVDVTDVEDMGMKFRWIKLTHFSDDKACQKIFTALINAPADTKGIIFDVRYNGGGLLNQAICIGGLFVGKQPIVLERKVENGVTQPAVKAYTSPIAQVTKLPLAVLINDGSASASEIFAGAMQDYGRGFLIGTRTFGKATVQTGIQMNMFPEIIRFETTARFYQPKDHTNQMVGIQPDFQVYRKPNPAEEEKYALHEADLVPAALPPEGTQWSQPRPAEIDAIKSGCLSKGRADEIYSSKGDLADYQLLKAEEVLSCTIAM